MDRTMGMPSAAWGWVAATMWLGNLRWCSLPFVWTECKAVTKRWEISVTPKPHCKLGLSYTLIKHTRKEQPCQLTQSSIHTLIWFLLLSTRAISKTWPSYRWWWREQNRCSQPLSWGRGSLGGGGICCLNSNPIGNSYKVPRTMLGMSLYSKASRQLY